MQRSYWRLVLGIIVIGFVINLAANVLIDPYQVFGLTDFNRKNFEVNSRFLKTEHLRGQRSYATIVFGTSRAQAYDEDVLTRLTGGEAFNFWVPGESMEGVFLKLQWLIREGYPLKRAFVCLDYDFMFASPAIDPYDLLRQEHYLVSGETSLRFYARYLAFQPRVIRKVIRANLFSDRVSYFFDRQRGRDIFPGQGRTPPQRRGGLLPENVTLPRMEARFRPGQMEAFRATIRLLKTNGIEASCLINPCHHLLLLTCDPQDYQDWLAGLVEGGATIWDFSGFTGLTMDDARYMDLSHFSRATGDSVLAEVLGGKPTHAWRLQRDTLKDRLAHFRSRYDELASSRLPPRPQGGRMGCEGDIGP